MDELKKIALDLFRENKILQEQIKSLQNRLFGRKPLPADLPRMYVVHELSEDDRKCDCGCLKGKIGEEVSDQLDYIPVKVRVIRNIRYKYACKNCER